MKLPENKSAPVTQNAYDLSIVVPSIREDKIQRLLDSIPASIKNYSYEVIVVGPYKPPEECLYIEDLGSPSRAVQRGALLASGKFVKWSTDDGIYRPGALSEVLDLAQTIERHDGIIVKYTEDGPANWVTGADDIYYTAWTHDSNKLAGIPEDYKIAPVALYHTDFFKEIGGLDCEFEHINMNTHDLAFRIQRNGGKFYFSPSVVMHCDSRNRSDEHLPLDAAYQLNDLPKFSDLYGTPEPAKDRINIDYESWEKSPSPWRRFK